MSTTSSNRVALAAELARAVLSEEPSPAIDIEHLHMRMEHAIAAHACALTGHEDRDITTIWSERDGDSLLYVGQAGDVLRLLASIDININNRSASITLRATKGSEGVDRIGWGSVGPEIGNSVLVARLLHIGIEVLRAEGVASLTNDPWDDRLRAHYELMGFHNGKHLPLDDEAALALAFGYIERVHRRFGLPLGKLEP